MASPDRRVFGLKPSNKNPYSLQQVASASLDPESLSTGLPTPNFSTGRDAQLNVVPVDTNKTQLGPNNQYTFTGKYAGYDRDLRAQEADAGFSRTENIQKVAEAFLKATERAATQKEKTRRSLMQMLADKGMSTSGITLDKSGELEGEYARYLDDIGDARSTDLSSIENNYARTLNGLYRKRDTLFGEQQAEEEQRRMEEARIAAETARQTAEADARRQELDAIRAAQTAAQEAAAAAAANYAPVYTPPSFGGGGGGGGDYPVAPEPAAAPAAPVQEERIISPFLSATGNVPGSAVDAWAKQTIDPNLSGANLRAVVRAITNAGARGLTRTELANIIQTANNGGWNESMGAI